MNIMQMMKQAQAMQQKLKDTQTELSNMSITGESAGGAVVVTCDGQGKFKYIKIKPEAINPDNPASVDAEALEMLEDVIAAAILDAGEKAGKEMETRMKAVTGGINIPGLNF